MLKYKERPLFIDDIMPENAIKPEAKQPETKAPLNEARRDKPAATTTTPTETQQDKTVYTYTHKIEPTEADYQGVVYYVNHLVRVGDAIVGAKNEGILPDLPILEADISYKSPLKPKMNAVIVLSEPQDAGEKEGKIVKFAIYADSVKEENKASYGYIKLGRTPSSIEDKNVQANKYSIERVIETDQTSTPMLSAVANDVPKPVPFYVVPNLETATFSEWRKEYNLQDPWFVAVRLTVVFARPLKLYDKLRIEQTVSHEEGHKTINFGSIIYKEEGPGNYVAAAQVSLIEVIVNQETWKATEVPDIVKQAINGSAQKQK